MPRSCSIFIQSDFARRASPRAFTWPAADRAAEQQQMLGQRGLAGVGMRDDRKGPPPSGFMGERVGHGRRGIHNCRASVIPARIHRINLANFG